MFFLTADIGGTHSRFALFEEKGKEYLCVDTIWLSSQGKASFSILLQELQAKDKRYSFKNIKKCVFALAGRIENPFFARLTNLPWAIDLHQLKKDFIDLPEILLINDFAAQALACASPCAENFIPLFPEKIQKEYSLPIVVVGAGTGFGTAFLFGERDRPLLLPSEGGHQSFPIDINREEEVAFARFLTQKKGIQQCIIENILSGAGLSLVHEFFTSFSLEAKEIPENSEAFSFFSICLARVLKNYCLALLPKTLVISGGIAAKHMHIFNEDFYREFTCSPNYTDYLKQIPLFLNTNENAALYGASLYLDS